MMKRLIAVVGGVFLATFALAIPASAHANVVKGSATCLKSGFYSITWTITNDYNLDEVASSRLVPSLPINKLSTATLTETAPGTLKTISLAVHGKWSDGATNDAGYTLTLDGLCVKPTPTPTPTTSTPAPPTSSTPAPPTSSTPAPPTSSAPVTPSKTPTTSTPVTTPAPRTSSSTAVVGPPVSTSKPVTSPVARKAPLAETGLDSGQLLIIGFSILALGSAAMVASRKLVARKH